MNYLAHAYLSFGHAEILLGNMISDFVKGKKQYDYPPVVHQGILLHRAIDAFTDFHPVIKKAKTVFHADYRLYSGAFIDVAFDHFLATDPVAFPKQTLFDFSQHSYAALRALESLMPVTFRRMFGYMERENWLYRYRSLDGIYQSFGGLVKRAAYLQDSTRAIELFESQYVFLGDCFSEFWPELRAFAADRYQTMTGRPDEGPEGAPSIAF